AFARGLERIENLPQAAALFLILDLARDAHLAHAGHHHQDSPGDAEVSRERGAFGADAFLDDLHDDLIAAAQAALDGRAVAAGHLPAAGSGVSFPAPPKLGRLKTEISKKPIPPKSKPNKAP